MRRSRETEFMKYMLLMNNMSRKPQYAGVTGWQQADVEAHTAYLRKLTRALRESGELASTEGLALPDEAKQVRAAKGGAPVIDGSFPEAKEFLAGYWVVEVANAQRAYEIAAHASAAPGPGGTPINMPIEVRRVMSREELV